MPVILQSTLFSVNVSDRAIEENSILYRLDMTPIGRVTEVFGQVEHPFYILRWPKSMTNPCLNAGDVVYVNNTTIQYILPNQLNCVGTDASNYYDEEPTEKERVFVECTEDIKGGEIGMENVKEITNRR